MKQEMLAEKGFFQRIGTAIGIGRKKESAHFTLHIQDLEHIAEGIISRIDLSNPSTKTSDIDLKLRKAVLALAGLPVESAVEFGIKTNERFGFVDLVVEGSTPPEVAFSLGLGDTKLTFMNGRAIKDVLIYKGKLYTELSSMQDAMQTVEQFIRLKPTKEEKLNRSKAAKDKRTAESQQQNPTSSIPTAYTRDNPK